jgi:hypothetical protein
MAKRVRRVVGAAPMPHRGRFQAQGGALDESEAWAQLTGLSIVAGRNLLNNLKNKLKPVHLSERLYYFEQWSSKIEHLHQNGGYDADLGGHYIKTIPHGASPDDPRVDLEIRKGKAFI